MKHKLIKWTGITVISILLFMAGCRQAFNQRGYYAIGGEIFLLLLPIMYYIIGQIALDLIKEIKNAYEGEEDA